MPPPRFHDLTISDLRRETADAVSLAFAVPERLRGAYRYEPGQYLTLRATIDGEEVRRSYSICSGLDDNELRVVIKRLAGGAFSNWANEQLRVGDTVSVMTPDGRFGVPIEPGSARTLVAFAAGSGITPVMAILRTVLRRETGRFYLFYGNRSAAEIIFREQLDDLKDRYLARLSVFHVLSREQQDIAMLNGHLDAAKIQVLMRSVAPVAGIDHAFVCGPQTKAWSTWSTGTIVRISNCSFSASRWPFSTATSCCSRDSTWNTDSRAMYRSFRSSNCSRKMMLSVERLP